MGKADSEKKIAEILGNFVANTRYEDLPPEVIGKVKEYIVDVVGCMVADRGKSRPESCWK